MTIPFFKLQIAGNGFILIDTASVPELDASAHDITSRLLCDRRYGIGATGVIFLSPDNTIRIFDKRGIPQHRAADALLCAARFSFDTGRSSHKRILFKTAREELNIDVLGAHEFRLSIGSPFSLLSGALITADSTNLTETLERDGVRTNYTALHINEDVVVAHPQGLGILESRDFTTLVRKAFPDRSVLAVIARPITRDTITVSAPYGLCSAVSAAAAAALVACHTAGMSDRESVVLFGKTRPASQPDESIIQDRDNSRRLAVTWDSTTSDLSVIGTGGYLFEGRFDCELSGL